VKSAVALTGAALALTASPAAHRTVAACDTLGTLSDPQRNLVRLRPKLTTVAALDRLRPPRRPPTTRTTAFQRRVWRVRAQIVEYKLERDGDIRLALYDDGAYLSVAMPAPSCLSAKTRARAAIEQARAYFEGLCGPARPSWRDLGAVAFVDGVGYWGARHAELRPVTRVRLIAGCA
jgi:hypothetical protein